MIKFSVLLLAILALDTQASSLKAYWLGVAGVVITDGQTTLLFDPVFTKPSIEHWIRGSEFKSNESLVRTRLERIGVKKADAVFSSHTHFDHAVDVAMVSKITNATVYGGPSLERIVKAQYNDVRFRDSPDGANIRLGSFSIHPYQRPHSPIFGEWKFLPGEVTENFSSKFYEYREGETWSFFIEHPAGNILIDQGSRFPESNKDLVGKVSTHFVGISNKLSLEDLVQNNIMKIGAKRVYPLHFDFFFLQSDWLESKPLPGTGLYEIAPTLRSKSSTQEFIIPVRDQEISIP